MQYPLRCKTLTHDKEDDCPDCIKDQRGRSLGVYCARVEKRLCGLCDGTGLLQRNKRVCTKCYGSGIYLWRTPTVTCKKCKGTAKRPSPETSMEYAFSQVETKKAPG
jgi:hypothetical protein